MADQKVPENADYTFGNFITVDSNAAAAEAAKIVVNRPGTVNPLYLWSPHRVGKTHLLQAVRNAYQAGYRTESTTYVKLDSFTAELKNTEDPEASNNLYQACAASDILLLDNIDFAAGDDDREDDLLALVKLSMEAGHQVVLASRLPPGTFPVLEKYLQSLPNRKVLKIEALWAYERQDLFEKSIQVDIPPELISAAADFELRNPHEVELFADRIRAYNTILRKPVSYKLMKKASRDIRHGEVRYDPEEIIALSAKLFSVSVDEVKGPTKYKNAVLARMISMYLLQESCGLGYSETKEFYSKNNPVSPFTSDLESMADEVTYRPEETSAMRRRHSFLLDDEDEDEQEDEDEV